MRDIVRRAVKGALHRVGLDLVRVKPDEKTKLHGLARLGIRSVVDVGANVGQFAALAAAALPGARIHCFEPVPTTFRELEAFCAQEGGGRIRAHNVALSDQEGTAAMWVPTHWHLASSLLRSTEASDQRWPVTAEQTRVDVQLATLDGFVEREGLDLPDLLIKLDVQGYEAHVLRGGAKTVARAKAAILEVNVDPLYDGQASFRDLFGLLDAHGLTYAGNFDQQVAADGHVIYLDAVFVRPAAQANG